MESGVLVTVGVNTHADAHVGVALDHPRRRPGEVEVQNKLSGYGRLLESALNLEELACVGVEVTGSFGVGLSRFLRFRSLYNTASRCCPSEQASPGRRALSVSWR